VTGGIEEGDLTPVGIDLVGPDVLGNAAGLSLRHIGRANRVEQLGLAMVDVPHDRDDRRSRPGFGVELGLSATCLEIVAFARKCRLFRTGLPAERLRHASGGGVIDLLVDRCHHAELH
jgi:hypothetical protein